MEELKHDITVQLDNLSENIDDETLEKINNFKEHLKSRYEYRSDEEKVKKLNKVNRGLSFYQRFLDSFQRNVDIDPGRLLGLTDGIFGMVMTLLVFGMALPEVKLLTAGDFIAFIHSIAPTFGVTIVSFVLVSSFWVYHHEFIKVKSLNIPYLWINILFLATISFVPFSTSLIGVYSKFFLAEVIFGINILLTIIFFLLMYKYADGRGFLVNKPSEEEKKYFYNTFLIIMGLTVAVNLLDFNVSSNFIYLFLLVPVISTLRDINFRMSNS